MLNGFGLDLQIAFKGRLRLLQILRLAVLVDVSTNRLSGFAIDPQTAYTSHKVAGKHAFGVLSGRACPQISGRKI